MTWCLSISVPPLTWFSSSQFSTHICLHVIKKMMRANSISLQTSVCNLKCFLKTWALGGQPVYNHKGLSFIPRYHIKKKKKSRAKWCSLAIPMQEGKFLKLHLGDGSPKLTVQSALPTWKARSQWDSPLQNARLMTSCGMTPYDAHLHSCTHGHTHTHTIRTCSLMYILILFYRNSCVLLPWSSLISKGEHWKDQSSIQLEPCRAWPQHPFLFISKYPIA